VAKRPARHWYIVVPHSAAANFAEARRRGLWGARDPGAFRGTGGEALEAGDWVHFVTEARWPGPDAAPAGFPRVELSRYAVEGDEFTARVTSDVFHDETPVWPDALYPFRFRFEPTSGPTRRRWLPGDGHDAERDALRRSQLQQGRAIDVPRMSLHAALEKVVREYGAARTAPFKEHPLAAFLREDLPNAVEGVAGLDPEVYRVEGSAGRSRWANVPWVAVLDRKRGGGVQDGIYVCYLFSEDLSRIVLGLVVGVSKPGERGEDEGGLTGRVVRWQARLADVILPPRWRLGPPPSLAKRGVARRYADAVLVYVEYRADEIPSDEVLERDLAELLAAYRRLMDGPQTAQEETPGYGSHQSRPFDLDVAKELLDRVRYRLEPVDLLAILLALHVRPFAIFSGRSGTGKTTLTRLLAALFGWTYRAVAVSPAWADPTDLLGFVSPVSGRRVPGALEPLLTSGAHTALLCLDEFNVAKVEHYFADFIAAMDHGAGASFWGPIDSLERLNDGSAPPLALPPRLYVIATMNFDDSVQSITPRVLDRASVVEFDVERADALVVGQSLQWDEAAGFEPLSWPWGDDRDPDAETVEAVQRLWEVLKGSRGQFGHRVAQEMARYVALGMDLEPFGETPDLRRARLLDRQIVQRLLPRFHGSAAHRDQDALARLAAYLGGRGPVSAPDPEDVGKLIDDVDRRLYPLTAAKLLQLALTVSEDGYAAYW
jgi:MoxR-like ATPase